jgi:hypothetical protein
VYAADGSEIVRRRGYLTPRRWSRCSRPSSTIRPRGRRSPDASPKYPRTIADGCASDGDLSRGCSPDTTGCGGWSGEHKFLDAGQRRVLPARRGRGDAEAGAVARDMLRLQRQLFDPAWGGVYQYSAEGDWAHPHFEKIMAIQADNLRDLFDGGRGMARLGIPGGGGRNRRYLKGFLRAPTAPSTRARTPTSSRRARSRLLLLDDAGRRARGIPRVDTHRYARENGWAIAALCAYFGRDGGAGAARRRRPGRRLGGRAPRAPGRGIPARRGRRGRPVPRRHLAMGSAFLASLPGDGDAAWLAPGRGGRRLRPGPFRPSAPSRIRDIGHAAQSFPRPLPEFDESVALARFANLLGHASGGRRPRLGGILAALGLVPGERVGERGPTSAASCWRARIPHRAPARHGRGGKDDPAARALFAAASRAPTAYRLLEWWDRSLARGRRRAASPSSRTLTGRPPTSARTGPARPRSPTSAVPRRSESEPGSRKNTRG